MDESSRSLTPISYLSSPVPDLASTLSTYPHTTSEQNGRSLRQSYHEPLTESSRQVQRNMVDFSRDPRLPGYDETRWNLDINDLYSRTSTQRERLQRYISHQDLFHNSPASTAAAYSNRTPSPNHRTLYDWAPSFAADWLETTENRRTTDAQLLHPEREAHIAMQARGQSRRERFRAGALPPFDTANTLEARTQEPSDWQAARTYGTEHNTHAQSRNDASPNATQRVLRYFMDRERSGLSEEEERARGTGWYRPHAIRARGHYNWTSNDWPTSAQDDDDRERARQRRVDDFRREYLAGRMPPRWVQTRNGRPNSSTPAVNNTSFFLENALKYLDLLRQCNSEQEAKEAAVECSLSSDVNVEGEQAGMIDNVSEVMPTQYSSWLQRGSTFDGHQYASTSPVPLHHRGGRHGDGTGSTSADMNLLLLRGEHPPGSTSMAPYGEHHSIRHAASGQPPRRPLSRDGLSRNIESKQNHWPVRVILHTVSAEKKIIQGTMEAYDVPQHSPLTNILGSAARAKAGNKNAPITTYVEGHILDFRTYSFLTPSSHANCRRSAKSGFGSHSQSETHDRCDDITFPHATPAVDAANWRKLPPFNQLASDHDMARLLLSKDALQKLNEEWIFMRWKERCFVHGKDDTCADHERRSDHDRGHGLTISGFYYVSMFRMTGAVEGLYFDPNSTPYQHLRLNGTQCMWPAWEFR